eukprot:TRINITY_DN35890_c0_g1_i1.p1 TRINITY_DN35890_c0_g1~~TRINITY_DN35890_c0_g1_i1.p1  ORF type:complete len:321 (-),score=51.33 TRINITY_DN35890_c0_g1_i1:41-1003(-)
MAPELNKVTDGMETTMAGVSFCFCSVGMLLFNKLAIHALPLVCTLIAVQMAFAVLALLIFAWKSLHIGSTRDLLRWMIVCPFFTGMLLTSVLALKNAPMSLVVVLRCLSPLAALAVERFYPEPLRVDSWMILSILVMFGGSLIYVSQLEMHSAHIWGIFWVFANSSVAVIERCLQRYLLTQDPVDMSKTSVTLVNNAAGIAPLLLAAYLVGEGANVHSAFAALSVWDMFVILLSCIIGIGIGYCGVWAQSLISATSFLVMVNANKFVIIGIEAFGLHEHYLNHIQIIGASLTILGACFYGQARQNVEALVQEKKGLLPAK